MLLAKPTPGVSIDDNGEWMLFTERDGYPPVEELARPELRIAGLRIDPNNYTPSRQRFINNIYLQKIDSGKAYPINGLPAPLSASDVSWSPDNHKIAFLNTTRDRVDLYVVDVSSQKAAKFNTTPLNAITDDYLWLDNETLLYYGILQPAAHAPKKPLAPKGPTIQENYGKASPRPTYQDMIKSPYDEELFAFYTTTQLIKNVNGTETAVGQPAIFRSISISPDKHYLLQRTIRQPFSYLVPYRGFPSTLAITDIDGNVIKHVVDLPSSETAPSGNDNVQNVPRSYEWRDDEAATLVWCEPLDSGLIKNEIEYHDAVYTLRAPFTSAPQELFRTRMRYSGITWGHAQLALVYENLRGKQLTQTSMLNPATGEMDVLFSRNTTDAYSYPGYAVTKPNTFDRDVLLTSADGRRLLFNNTSGSSPKGDLPFLLSYDLETQMADTLWRCS